MRKDEITFRRTNNGYGEGRATVNIKVPWQALDSVIATAVLEEAVPEAMTEEWIRENVSEQLLDAYFWAACESEFEYFQAWAGTDEDAIMPGTTFEVDGRSGGWAVSNWTEDDVEGWDAVQVNRWAKIERVARDIARGVNFQMVMMVYLNEYEPAIEAVRKRGRALHRASFSARTLTSA